MNKLVCFTLNCSREWVRRLSSFRILLASVLLLVSAEQGHALFLDVDLASVGSANRLSIVQAGESELDIFIPETTGSTISHRIELSISETVQVDILSYPSGWSVQSSNLDEYQQFTFVFTGFILDQSELYDFQEPWLIDFRVEDENNLLEGRSIDAEIGLYAIAKNPSFPFLTPSAVNLFETVSVTVVPEASDLTLILGGFSVLFLFIKRFKKWFV